MKQNHRSFSWRLSFREAAHPIPQRASASGGFSLVEVCIAIGVIGVSMLCMLLMLPVGLSGMRAARVDTVRAQIVQNRIAKALETDFGQFNGTIKGGSNIALTSNSSTYFYYDDQGQYINSSDAPQVAPPVSGSSNAYARATYRVSVTATNSVVYPGSSSVSTTAMSKNAVTVTVKTEAMNIMIDPRSQTYKSWKDTFILADQNLANQPWP